MTTDPFTEAARAEAERRWSRDQADGRPLSAYDRMNRRIGFDLGAQWAAAQEPTDVEVLAALNADYALRFGPSNLPADSLEPYGDEHVQIMRAALSAARAARRDEEKRDD